MQVQENLRQCARDAFAMLGYAEAVDEQVRNRPQLTDDERDALRKMEDRLRVQLDDVVSVRKGLATYIQSAVFSSLLQLEDVANLVHECIDGLKELISLRDVAIHHQQVIENYWNDELQSQFVLQADAFEEFYNSLTLKRPEVLAIESQLSAFIQAMAGTGMDLDKDLEAASVEFLLADSSD